MAFRSGTDLSKTDSVRTPPYIVSYLKREFNVEQFYDPVPYNDKFDPKKDKDALTTDWGPISFVNPPYSQVKKFFLKGVEQWKKGKTVIFLIKTDNLATEYFRKSGVGSEIWIISHRITFVGYEKSPNNTRFNSCIVVLRANSVSDRYKIISLKKLVGN